ncbi:MAG TPA: NADH-quinone oxidoreductase subunit C [Bacteroidia bacterium]|nr:NADH-quinone oxidoreductase subunit C [Bacteroidia bacterium]
MEKEALLTLVHQQLSEKFKEEIISAEMAKDFPVFTVKKEKIQEIFQFLYETKDLEFTFLTDLCGVHYPNNKSRELGVVYHLHNMQKNYRIRIKTFTSISDTSVPTMTKLFSSANWMERETYDFYGIDFKGHPDLRRILNVDDMVIFPLRKEYPLEDPTREDKNDAMFGR